MSSTSSTLARGIALLGGQRGQVTAGAAARVERLGLEQRADLAQRPAQLAVAAAADSHLAGVGPVQPEDQPHRGGLARPVGAEEAGDAARPHVEAERVDRDRRPYRLVRFRASITRAPSVVGASGIRAVVGADAKSRYAGSGLIGTVPTTVFFWGFAPRRAPYKRAPTHDRSGRHGGLWLELLPPTCINARADLRSTCL